MIKKRFFVYLDSAGLEPDNPGQEECNKDTGVSHQLRGHSRGDWMAFIINLIHVLVHAR